LRGFRADVARTGLKRREFEVNPHYRGRFAPTPSGPLHFGSLVAAVGSYLEAKSKRGEWHVRIDDLDPPRVVPGATDAILRCLETLGFQWDGAVTFQSRRRDAYHAALHQLIAQGLVYPCACSRKDLAAARLIGSEGPVYPGTCRAGTSPGRAARALRLRTAGAEVRFEDGFLGWQERDLEREAGDFILYRADGVFSFHLAAAVDDAEQGMTDVVRGADLLESSARQIYVLRCLGLSVPRYAHLPIAVDAQGEKLSKQTHAAPLDLAHPVAELVRALRFLDQPLPGEFATTDVHAVWQWATLNWRPEHMPRSALHRPAA
jgi:glutamyl-Q tRNA(Asp) synthetase